MPVNNRHAQYRSKKYELMRACLEGDESVKALGTSVLPKPTGILANELSTSAEDQARAAADWKNYKFRADYPDLLGATMDGLIGLAFRKPWEIELPPRLEGIADKATPEGKTLSELCEHVVREALLTARVGLFSDNHDGTPLISVYQAESIVNWRGCPPTMVVLEEKKEVVQKDRFSTRTEVNYRELMLDENRYRVIYHKQKSNSNNSAGYTEEEKVQGLQEGEIPFVFVGSQSLDVGPDSFIPLWPMAKKLLKAFEVSADYYQAMHMTAQPTLFLKGFGDAVPNVAGAMVTLSSDSEFADGKYIEFSGKGVESAKSEIERQIEAAMLFSHYLHDKGSSVESGSALGIRVSAKTATLRSVVQTVGAAIEQSLKYAAQWISANPDDVQVFPNLEFTEAEVEAALIQAYSNSAKVPSAVLYSYLRKVGATQLEDEELEDLVDGEAEKAEARMLGMQDNLAPESIPEDEDEEAA